MWIYGVWHHYHIVSIDGVRKYEDFLWNWTDTVIMLYFLYSFLITLASFVLKNDTDNAKWFQYPLQLLYEISLSITMLSSLLYFTLEDGEAEPDARFLV